MEKVTRKKRRKNKMGRFSKYLGKTEIEVGGEKLKLKATVKDQQKVVNLRKSKDQQLVETVKILTDILSKSYPDEPKEELEAFATRNAMDMIKKLAVAWKWVNSEEEINKSIEKAASEEDPLGKKEA